MKIITFSRWINAMVLIALSVMVFLVPAMVENRELADSGIRSAGIPESAWKLHRALTPKYERWAIARLDSARATGLSINDISGTEWPLFGSVFYLWATESLQAAWEKSHEPGALAPNVYAKGAIAAATRLVIDPAQASWVKTHWGTNYLQTENVFYRMLVIAALTSHATLTEDRQYLPLLKDQVAGLSRELDASPNGLLDDYPGQCYPGDVLTAIAMIQRADKVLGTDHATFVRRAIRGFQGKALDARGLVPYMADAGRGEPFGASRGCGNSYVSLFAPEIWPEQAKKWYELYARHFWQEKWTCAGFREFPNDLLQNDWYADVDAGPVLKGFGCAACAFGAGAARVNGRFDHAFPLTAQMIVTSWPLWDGTRLLPRLFSNATDAPYLGEAGVLFNLTRTPADGFSIQTGGSIPVFVWIFLLLQIGIGGLLLVLPIRSLYRWRKTGDRDEIHRPKAQAVFWICLMVGAAASWILGKVFFALLFLLCAQLLFRRKNSSSGSLKTHAA